MKQETNTAATTLEQVNAMPAATWGWLKMNQTNLELSDELATAPAEAVEIEGLDEQFAGSADAFDAAMDAMAERFPERRASAPGDAADRARITPETYQAAVQKLMDLLERFKTMAVKDRAAYTYRAMDELIRSRETVEAEAEEVGDKKEEKEDEKVDGKEAAKPKARTAKTGEKQATDEKVEKITNN